MAQLTRQWQIVIVAGLFLLNSSGSLIAQVDQSYELRIWNDRQGNETTARFVRYREGFVYIRSSTRRTVRVEPGQLSKKDQDYVVKILREEKKDKLADEFQRLAQSSGVNRGSGLTPGSSINGGRANGGTNSGGSTNAGGTTLRTPRGESPMSSGGQTGGGGQGSGRAPSPYTATPDADYDPTPKMKNPSEVGGIDPFAEIDTNAMNSPAANSSAANSGISKVRNPEIDPFKEIRPPSNQNSPIRQSPTNINGNSGSYTPPVIENKLDDAQIIETDPSTSVSQGSEKNEGFPLMILLGVIAIMLLISIGLLVILLVKAQATKPRRGYQ